MKEEKSDEVQELLEYGEKTAGRLMTPDMLAVLEDLTVAQAVEQVRKSPVAETAPILYVVSGAWAERPVTRPSSTPPGPCSPSDWSGC